MKQLFLLLLVSLLAFSATAQDSKWQLGAYAGTGSRTLHGNDFLDPLSDVGLAFEMGGTIQYKAFSSLQVRGTLAYQLKGNRQNIQVTDEFGSSTGTALFATQMDYLSMRGLLVLPMRSDASMYAVAGSHFGYLTSAWQVSDAFPDVDVTEGFKATDFGVSLGLGVAPAINDRWHWSVEMLYDYGLANLGHNDNRQDFLISTMNLQLLAGVRYQLGGTTSSN